MKKINFVLLFIIIITSFHCNNKNEHPADLIISEINDSYGNFIDNQTLGDGTLFYSFSVKGNDILGKEKQIIGLIDRNLNSIPLETKENQRGLGGQYRYNFYKWNTPLVQLDVQTNFYVNNQQDSIYVRLWMIRK